MFSYFSPSHQPWVVIPTSPGQRRAYELHHVHTQQMAQHKKTTDIFTIHTTIAMGVVDNIFTGGCGCPKN